MDEDTSGIFFTLKDKGGIMLELYESMNMQFSEEYYRWLLVFESFGWQE